MLCEYARTLEDAFDCGPGVFFGGAGDRGERADMKVDGSAGGVFRASRVAMGPLTEASGDGAEREAGWTRSVCPSQCDM